MTSHQGLPVIDADAARFRSFTETHTPVVIRGLFDTTELSSIRTLDSVRARLGEAVVNVKGNVLERYVGALDPKENFSWSKILSRTRATTIGKYLDEIEQNQKNGQVASEQPAPQEILEMIGASEFLSAIEAGQLASGHKHGSLPKASCLVFLATQGNATDTHTDWDGRHVINYQVFGRKRFLLFPPGSGPKLSPVEIFSTVRLRGMSERSLKDFLQYAGGVEAVLEPGDAIYMPPFYFHHVEYLEHAMGVALRFAPPPERVVASMFRCHRDLWVQNVWARIVHDPESPESQEALAAFESAIAASYGSRVEKYRAILALARSYCERWGVFGEDPSVAWLSSSDFLEHVLSVRYVKREVSPNASWGETFWHAKERTRLAVEMFGRRVISFLQQV